MKIFILIVFITFIFISNHPMIDKLVNKSDYRNKDTLKIIGNLLFSNNYEPAFVAGILSNIYYEQSIGKFESSNYGSHPEREPQYLKIMDENYYYREKYSGKSITDVSMKGLGTLLEHLKQDNWENGTFGLGCFQWNGSRTYDLFQIYNQECGECTKISIQEATTSEGKMIINELKGSYSYIYNDWKKNNPNPNSPESASNAGILLTMEYVIPKDPIEQANARAATAKNMYNIMIMGESNNNQGITEAINIKVPTTEQLSIKEYFSIDLSYYYETNVIIEKENELKNRTEFIQNMINNAFKKLNIANIDGGKDEKISDKNISIIITSTKNQKINENEKVITIDLGKCENILKKEYNISQNDSLYILEIISEEEEGMKIPKIEYEVYYSSYNDNNLDKLNLTLCKGTKIEISIPVKINGNIDKYNKSSNYYNDVCYKTITESGTDISLKDRRNEFVENNMTLCEENCELIDYNYINEKAKCSCEIKTTITPDYDFEFNKKEFFRSFTDVTSISNINIIKCYEIILNIKNLINNYGFCILASIMLLYIISLFIFWFYSYKKLKMNLFYIYIILYRFQQKQFQPTFNGKKKGFKQKIIKAKPIKRRNNKNSSNDIFINFNMKNSIINNYDKKNKKNQLNNVRQITQNKKNKFNSRLNNINMLKFYSYNIKISYIKKLLEQKHFEINSLNYENALKIDKRNYFQYYTSLLNNNHPLIFSFCNYDDYNSLIIKIYLFFFLFALI